MNKHPSYSASISLLHAIRKWLGVITTALWPFAYKFQEKCHNHLDLNTDGLSPIEVFLGHKKEILAEDFHSWGCPIYVIDSTLQTDTGIGLPKWDPQSRVGVCLGHSLVHAGNVALILSLQIGHVSPQYCVISDDEFTTPPTFRLRRNHQTKKL
eukprot:13415709-Ditylum_brightwellii.AAC.1